MGGVSDLGVRNTVGRQFELAFPSGDSNRKRKALATLFFSEQALLHSECTRIRVRDVSSRVETREDAVTFTFAMLFFRASTKQVLSRCRDEGTTAIHSAEQQREAGSTLSGKTTQRE